MQNKDDKFWPLPPSSKLSELQEKRHEHHLHAALLDPDTCITECSRDVFIIHGGYEGLLFRPVSIIWGIGARICAGLCNILSQDVTE